MKQLTAAVIGLGLGRHHVTYYAARPEVQRLIVCDPDPARLERARHEFGVSSTYTDIGTMLAAEAPDVVSIVTPDHMHRAHAEQVLTAGSHVLLTKPIANTRADAEAIVTAARTHGRKLMVAHEARYRARFMELRRLVAEGHFGETISMRLDSIWDKRDHFSRSPWYASQEAGRSVLTGTGIHEVDLIRFILGQRATRVYASGNSLGDLQFPREKTVIATIDFEGGCVAHLAATYVARWPKAGEIADPLRIIGTKGMAVGNRYSHDGVDGWVSLPTEGNGVEDGTKGCVNAFVDAVVNDSEVPISGAEALASLEVCFAADESVASGNRILLGDRAQPSRKRA
jgi:UDP-N-acetylglucosamine 3-dehydrogenase